ncbi:hypothetical protein NEAUS03_1011 [Nematocida ausubeli]|nr:hypothetical protein NEAUS03_1011 [Nematocida ausubeli]
MDNRTYIKDLQPGANSCVFGLLLTHTPLRKTTGSDYQMVLNIVDEHSEKHVPVLLFMSDPECFPKYIIENQTVIKITRLTVKNTNGGTRLLIDRKHGCFFFDVCKEQVNPVPYFSCAESAYVSSMDDWKILDTVRRHFIQQISIGPGMISGASKENAVVSVYGYVKDIMTSHGWNTVVLCDPSTYKDLYIRVWERGVDMLPKKHTYVCMYSLKVRKNNATHITVDVSKSAPFVWTYNIPSDVKTLLSAFTTINTRKFISALVHKINKVTSENNEADDVLDSEGREDLSAILGENGSKSDLAQFSDEAINGCFIEDSPDCIRESRESVSSAVSSADHTQQSADDSTKNISDEKDLHKSQFISNEIMRSLGTQSNGIPCTPDHTLEKIIHGKEYFISFKETDNLYDEIIQIPIKPYYMNKTNSTVTFDQQALFMMDPETREKEHIQVQHVGFYKKVPMIFHVCARAPGTLENIAGFITLLPSKTPTLHVFLYKNPE